MKTCTNPHHGKASRKHYANGLCEACWKRLRDRGTLEPAQGLTKTCSLDECDKAHVARGYCKPHWRAWKLYGDPTKLNPWGRKKCDYPGCKERHSAKGLCKRHLGIRYWILRETKHATERPKVPVGPVLDLVNVELGRGVPWTDLEERLSPAEKNGRADLARLLEKSPTDLINRAQADAYAIGLGTHPAILWPDEWITEVAA